MRLVKLCLAENMGPEPPSAIKVNSEYKAVGWAASVISSNNNKNNNLKKALSRLIILFLIMMMMKTGYDYQ